jgi:AmiR/NasT family two-component response regulator
VLSLMTGDGCDENEAYGRLRREAMQTRLTLEQVAASLLAGPRRQAG